jgi:hypothetical protein
VNRNHNQGKAKTLSVWEQVAAMFAWSFDEQRAPIEPKPVKRPSIDKLVRQIKGLCKTAFAYMGFVPSDPGEVAFQVSEVVARVWTYEDSAGIVTRVDELQARRPAFDDGPDPFGGIMAQTLGNVPRSHSAYDEERAASERRIAEG